MSELDLERPLTWAYDCPYEIVRILHTLHPPRAYPRPVVLLVRHVPSKSERILCVDEFGRHLEHFPKVVNASQGTGNANMPILLAETLEWAQLERRIRILEQAAHANEGHSGQTLFIREAERQQSQYTRELAQARQDGDREAIVALSLAVDVCVKLLKHYKLVHA